MSTLRVNAIQNTSGVEQYLARAWVNFNGTGTVAIRASGNVSSITDNGVGDYTVNFTNAFADANYSAVPSFGTSTTSNAYGQYSQYRVHSTGSFRFIAARDGSGTVTDVDTICVAVFR